LLLFAGGIMAWPRQLFEQLYTAPAVWGTGGGPAWRGLLLKFCPADKPGDWFCN